MEHLISREAVSGSLESFPPSSWRFGTGAQNFSKIKAPAWESSQPQKATNNLAKIYKAIAARPRALAHLVMIILVTSLVAGSHYTDGSAASLLAKKAGFGAVVDNTTSMNVAATIAAAANLSVSSDATSKAQSVNAQVALPTTGDEFLAKRQVVATAGSAARGIITYTVESGDSLGSIASKFGITSNTIRWVNDIDGDVIKPGQDLQILPISGLLYTVKDGDTADSLAAKFQSNAAQIISFNNAEVKGLQVGQKIIIPDGVLPEPPKPAPAPAAAAPRLTYYSGGGNGYAYGQCTWYVANRRAIPSSWGNAWQWYYNAQASGFAVGRYPVPGAIAWTPYGGGGYGHVAYVEQVSGSQILISEMNNWAYGGWNVVDTIWVPASQFPGYIY